MERIDKQRGLIARLEAEGQSAVAVRRARELLKEMVITLEGMLSERQRLIEASEPLDEASMDAVSRESPL
jgi:hypothetical protein